MKNTKLQSIQRVRPAVPSPWLDPDLTNDFRHEIQLARENLPCQSLIPDPAYAWIHANNAENLLYKGLAKFAPLLGTAGYDNEVSLWTAPPLSGAGNVVCMVIGKDDKNKVRVVGGNYFASPNAARFDSVATTRFFRRFDSLSSDMEKMNLVTDTFSKSISEANSEWIHQVGSRCTAFYTMPIYLLVLDGEKNFLSGAPAVVEGMKQTDFSLECFGEVTL
jgi:hypothetical protein